MAKGSEYELAIKIAGKVDNSFKNATKSAQGELKSFSATAKNAFKGIAVAGAAITTAAVAAGKALYDLGAEFDSAYDAIRIGTGATGDALEDLKGSMKDVYSSVPTDMESAATAISDYNTRLGVTGDTLETLSTQALQVSDMLGDDLSGVIESSSTAFQNWGIGAEDMAGAMDYVFKVSQSTGVGFTDLMNELQTYGSQLQAVGYDFEQSATLLGQVEKAGYDASTVFTALKTAAKNAADDGFSNINEGLNTYIDRIKNADSETEAYAIATEVFGSKAASTMVSAISSGALSLEELQAQLEASSESIGTAAEDTYDLAEKWTMFTNRMKVALEPMATTMFDSVNDAVTALLPAVEALAPVITDSLAAMLPAIQELVPVVVDFAQQFAGDILPVLADLIASVLPTIVSLLKGLLPVVIQFASTVLPPVIALIDQLLPPLMQIIDAILPVVSTLIQALAPILTSLMSALSPVLTLVTQLITPIANIISKLSPIIALVGQLITVIIEQLSPVITFISELIGSVLNVAFESIMPIIDAVTGVFGGLIDFISNVFAGNWSGAWESIVGVFGSVFGGIVAVAKAPINAVISAINFVLEKINGISVTVPDWVPLIGGTTLGFSIPTIPLLEAGGVVTDATLAMVGEGSEPEAILPLSKLAAMLEGIGGGGGDTNNDDHSQSDSIVFAPVFNFYGGANKEEAEEAGRISFAEFKRLYQQMRNEERRKSFSMA